MQIYLNTVNIDTTLFLHCPTKDIHYVKSVQIRSRSFSGPYFPVIGLNTEIYCKSPYSVQIQDNTDQKKLRIWTLFTE